jgi:hypothetical protein
MHHESMLGGFFLKFFKKVEQRRGGNLTAVLKLADVVCADSKPAGQLLFWHAQAGTQLGETGGKFRELTKIYCGR